MHTVGPGIWRETLKNLENETHTLYILEYAEKKGKMQKMTNAHCRTWNMARELKKKNVKNEKHTL